jgi:hypothetical protein
MSGLEVPSNDKTIAQYAMLYNTFGAQGSVVG